MWSPILFECWTEHEGNVPVLCVRGELDMSTERQFRHQLEELVDEKPFVVIDLSEVTYIDLSTIRGLEHYSSIARRRGGRLVIANPSKLVRRVLDIVELERQIPIAASRQEALDFIVQSRHPGS